MDTQSVAKEAASAFVEAVTERWQELPGWGLLIFTGNVVADRLHIGAVSWLVVPLAGIASYGAGEWIDKRVFSRPEQGVGLHWRWSPTLQRARGTVKGKMGIFGDLTHTWEGYYQVARALTPGMSAAEARRAHVFNELGKWARSLIVPAILAGLALSLSNASWIWGLIGAGFAIVLCVAYYLSKAAHMATLYLAAATVLERLNKAAAAGQSELKVLRLGDDRAVLIWGDKALGTLRKIQRPKRPRRPFRLVDEPPIKDDWPDEEALVQLSELAETRASRGVGVLPKRNAPEVEGTLVPDPDGHAGAANVARAAQLTDSHARLS